MIRILTVLATIVFALPAAAQSLIGCQGWQGHAQAIPEPWENHTRTFSNGNVRVALLDTIEPANGAFYLLILTPPFDELGGRTCEIIAEGDGQQGFNGLFFDQLEASYDPATGLTLRVPVSRFLWQTSETAMATLAVTINQATGDIFPRFDDFR